MHPYIAAAMSRKRSGLAAFDHVLPTARLATSFRTVDRRPARTRSGGGVARCLTTFVLGSVAQGAPFVLVGCRPRTPRREPGWLAAVAAVRLAPYLVCSPVAGALAGRLRDERPCSRSPGSHVVRSIAGVVDRPGRRCPGAGAGVTALRARRRRHPDVPGADADGSRRRGAGPSRPHERARRRARVGCLRCRAGARRAAAPHRHHELTVGVRGDAGRVGGARNVPAGHGWDDPYDWRDRAEPVRNAGRLLFRPDVRTAIIAVLGVNVLAGLNAALARPTSRRASLGRRARVRAAVVRLRRGGVRRVRRPPRADPPRAPSAPATRPRPVAPSLCCPLPAICPSRWSCAARSAPRSSPPRCSSRAPSASSLPGALVAPGVRRPRRDDGGGDGRRRPRRSRAHHRRRTATDARHRRNRVPLLAICSLQSSWPRWAMNASWCPATARSGSISWCRCSMAGSCRT